MTGRTEEDWGGPSPALAETLVERICCGLCELILLAMVLMTSAEVVARLFNHSFELADEIGGYLLAALSFLALPVALIGGAFHQVDYFQRWLGPRALAATGAVFTLLSLVFALVLEWQLWRLVTRSHASDVLAPTMLGTPLWIPQSAMLIGTGALIYSLLRVLARQMRAACSNREDGDARMA